MLSFVVVVVDLSLYLNHMVANVYCFSFFFIIIFVVTLELVSIETQNKVNSTSYKLSFVVVAFVCVYTVWKTNQIN